MIDLFFRTVYVFFIIELGSRCVVHFPGSVRRECLDHLLIVSDGQLYRVLEEYFAFFNVARPHQGINQAIPEKLGSRREEKREEKIIAFPVLNGLQHDYRRVA